MDFDSKLFFEVLFSSAFVTGAAISISLATLSQLIAILIGFLLANLRLNKNPFLKSFSSVYIWLFRAIPALLLLLIVWNALPQLIPAMRQDWYSPFLAALLALSILEGAYMAEILRSSIMSVDDGQALAARALGMTPIQVMRKVIIPQLTRIAIPPTANEYIGMIKYTSLASVISLQELLTRAGNGVSVTFRYVEYYAGALVYYLVIVSILMVLQARLERRFAWISSTKQSPKVSR
jgi:His/Glu/Gln/Arg/opine family amino acid ABC transporter permease subunit